MSALEQYSKMSSTERTIFIEMQRHAFYKRPLTHKHFEQFGIDKRMLAATVREMNEKYKGWIHIGSDKRGYWFCRDEKEAIASMLSYQQTILSSLGERKKIKEQIRLTFSKDRNLFGEVVLDEGLFPAVKNNMVNTFLETS